MNTTQAKEHLIDGFRDELYKRHSWTGETAVSSMVRIILAIHLGSILLVLSAATLMLASCALNQDGVVPTAETRATDTSCCPSVTLPPQELTELTGAVPVETLTPGALVADDDNKDNSLVVMIPTSTSLPTETFTPAPTNTSLPTETSTPLPTETETVSLIDVFTASIEFKSSYKDYLDAMDLSTDQVMTFTEKREINGVVYRFLVAMPDQSKLTSEQQKYKNLYTANIVGYSVDGNAYSVFTPRSAREIQGIVIGTMSHPPGTGENRALFSSLKRGTFNSAITITDAWSNREKSEGKENLDYLDDQIEEVFSLNPRDPIIRISHLASHPTMPDWLQAKGNAEFQELVLEHISEHMEYVYLRVVKKARMMSTTDVVLEFNVTNEIWNSSIFAKKFGSRDQFIEAAVRTAMETREGMAYGKGQPIGDIRLGISQADSHYTEGTGFKQLLETLDYLEQRGVRVDYVDLHGHEKDFTDLPPISSVDNAFSVLRDYTGADGNPVDILIGEYDLHIGKLQGQDRFLQQASRYRAILDVALRLDVDSFTLWGVADSESWYETDIQEMEYRDSNADALVFNDKGKPKPSYYAIIGALSSRILGSDYP